MVIDKHVIRNKFSKENTPLLPHNANNIPATSSFWGATMNLTNTVLGSGSLAVPFAMASSGWMFGNFIMLCLALLTRYSIYLLLSASEMAGEGCPKTYEGLGFYTMGTFGSLIAEFTFIFGGFGTVMSYLIFVTNLIGLVLGIESNQWIITVIIVMFIVIPLSLNRRIADLEFISTISITATSYVVAFVGFTLLIAKFSYPVAENSQHSETPAIIFDGASVYTVTLLVGAFACHNTALPVYNELKDRTIPKMNKVVLVTITIAFIMYEVIGLSGFLVFGLETKDDILLNYTKKFLSIYPSLRLPLLLGRMSMATALLLTAPTAIWPFRSCILSMYLRLKNGGKQIPSQLASPKELYATTICSLIVILLSSIFVPSVKIPLSIVGSVSGSLLIFILPATFYLRLSPPQHYTNLSSIGPILMIVFGLMLGILGLTLTIRSLLETHN